MVDINKRLRYEGTAGLCDPKTGAVLNLTELSNGELKQIFVADGGEGDFFGTPELKRIQQQSCFSTLKSPIWSALAMKQLDTTEEEDKLFEHLRQEGESDKTKALRMEKEKEERHRPLQQHQQQWKNFSWGKQNTVVSVSTGASQHRKSPPSYAITNTNNSIGVVDDNNTVISNITDAVDDNNKHIMSNKKYDYTDDLLSPERITSEINRRIDDSYTMKQIRKKGKLSVPVAAFIEYLLDQFPFWFDKNNNNIKVGSNKEALRFYRRVFRPGTLGFNVPCASSIDPQPCPNYKAIEGRTFYLINWHLNIPGIDLRCHKPSNDVHNICNGRFIHQSSYDYRENNAATIVIDPDGNTNYAVSMRYKCDKCNQVLKGNDGALFHH